jgi:hypothetical protein
MPMNCSADMLDAINDAPIAHHVSDPSARKKSVEVSLIFSFAGRSQCHKRTLE